MEPRQQGDGLYGWERAKAMLAVALAVLLSVLDYAVANVALPNIAHDLHIASSQSIWVINAYQLASLAMLLPLASIGARIGFARMCRLGIAIFLVASVLCALSQNLLELALARALQGIGGASIMSVAIALIRFIYPRHLLGKGLALNGLVVGTGVALGPTIGSLVMAVAPWPWIFWINVPLGGMALLMASLALPITPRSDRAVDVKAVLLTIAAFTFTVIGVDDAVHGGLLSALVLSGVGIVCWIALLRHQRRSAEPIVPVDLLALPSFLIAFIVGMTGFVASNFFIIAMPFTLETVFHRPVTVTGFLITPWAVGVAMMSFLIGRWTDRIPATLLSSLGLAITGTGFALLWLLPADASNFDIIWRSLLAGSGFGMFQPPNNRVMMLAAPRGREGSASGLVSVARLGGQTLGALLVASVFRFSTHASTLCLVCAMLIAWLGASLSLARAFGGRSRA
ncbi:MFS transporter [Asaia astilbis]|uniref:MFS transporter n=1 Tax=Asaia astilbis TaxID=610244 RepID=UPI00046FDA53|nr:MFS transporter [Asaia astilbis]